MRICRFIESPPMIKAILRCLNLREVPEHSPASLQIHWSNNRIVRPPLTMRLPPGLGYLPLDLIQDLYQLVGMILLRFIGIFPGHQFPFQLIRNAGEHGT